MAWLLDQSGPGKSCTHSQSCARDEVLLIEQKATEASAVAEGNCDGIRQKAARNEARSL